MISPHPAPGHTWASSVIQLCLACSTASQTRGSQPGDSLTVSGDTLVVITAVSRMCHWPLGWTYPWIINFLVP